MQTFDSWKFSLFVCLEFGILHLELSHLDIDLCKFEPMLNRNGRHWATKIPSSRADPCKCMSSRVRGGALCVFLCHRASGASRPIPRRGWGGSSPSTSSGWK